jgi:hypothetical protein
VLRPLERRERRVALGSVNCFSTQEVAVSPSPSPGRRPYSAPAIRDFGNLVELTATVGGGLSDVPQGTPIGSGCQDVADCFS